MRHEVDLFEETETERKKEEREGEKREKVGRPAPGQASWSRRLTFITDCTIRKWDLPLARGESNACPLSSLFLPFSSVCVARVVTNIASSHRRRPIPVP